MDECIHWPSQLSYHHHPSLSLASLDVSKLFTLKWSLKRFTCTHSDSEGCGTNTLHWHILSNRELNTHTCMHACMHYHAVVWLHAFSLMPLTVCFFVWINLCLWRRSTRSRQWRLRVYLVKACQAGAYLSLLASADLWPRRLGVCLTPDYLNII